MVEPVKQGELDSQQSQPLEGPLGQPALVGAVVHVAGILCWLRTTEVFLE